MAAVGKQRDTRADRDRSRVYQARRAFHDGQARRRRRDDVIAGVGGGLLILAIVGGQSAYFLAGPGAPAPTAEPTAEPTGQVSPTPTSSPAP